MTVRVFRRIAWCVFGAYVLVVALVAPRVLARASERGEYGKFAVMVLPIVGAALIALFVATHPRSARATNEPNKPQSDLGMGFLFLGGLAVATAYLVAVDGLGLVVPIRYNIAAFGIFMIALGMLQKTPDADRLPTTPTGRWLAVRWRWGYLSLTGARATVALFSSDTSLPLMLLIPAQSTLPGELWGRERRMPLREERR